MTEPKCGHGKLYPTQLENMRRIRDGLGHLLSARASVKLRDRQLATFDGAALALTELGREALVGSDAKARGQETYQKLAHRSWDEGRAYELRRIAKRSHTW